MPQMTGIELARSLRNGEDSYQMVFLTTSPNHAIEAFSLHAVHYLVKPFTYTQLEDALSVAMNAVNKRKKSCILLKTSSGIRNLNPVDLIYSETDKHLQYIHLVNKEQFQVRMGCSELYSLISSDSRFYKCGSTYIINLDRVREVTTHTIYFDNGEEVPMQRRQYRELLELYTKYTLEMI
jgi:DNA-binding LytR/AlgR family response regulator